MIADLSMYDWPGIRAETDAFWTETARRLRAEGIVAPDRLARNPDLAAAWCDPHLLLGQTCGMPYVSGLCGDAVIVAQPDYGLPGAEGGAYQSVIVVRSGNAGEAGPSALLAQAGGRVAVNEWRSYSGHIALRAHLAGLRGGAGTPFFGAAVLSGGHKLSARMVVQGEADLAALDGVVWALLQSEEPETAGRLAAIGWTDPAPALPFITGARNAELAGNLAAALAGAASVSPRVPGLPCAVMPASADDYLPTRAAARRAAAEPFAPEAPAVPRV
jgi:ABC-type phosphate/phosphonate transport system substrate-binding protein